MAHRLWFVAGEAWPQNLKQLFADVPGLCTPAQFIRLPLLEEGIFEQLVPAAQKVFSEAQTDRAEKMRTCANPIVSAQRASVWSADRNSGCGMTPAQPWLIFCIQAITRA